MHHTFHTFLSIIDGFRFPVVGNHIVWRCFTSQPLIIKSDESE
jgi:hypothetical protein